MTGNNNKMFKGESNDNDRFYHSEIHSDLQITNLGFVIFLIWQYNIIVKS